MTKDKKTPTIENKRAFYDYYIDETLECGIQLKGNEVKSLREGKASIKESWVAIENGEMIIKKMHITPWKTSNAFDVDENRERKLLAHKDEIRDFDRKVQAQGYTLVPLKAYFKYGKCKLLVGLAKGKHIYDKRHVEKTKQAKLDMQRAIKNL